MSMILNPYRYAGAAGPTFGNASRAFDGDNDTVVVGQTGDFFSNNTDFTVACWYKTASVTLFDGILGNDNYNLSLRMTGTKTVSFYINNASNEITVTPTTAAGEWSHLSASFSTTNGMRVRVDGTETTNSITTLTVSNPSADLRIGLTWVAAYNRYFHGNISDFKIYDRELSGSEISDLEAGTHVSSGVVGRWFSDSDDVLDYSGNGNDGTNNGSTYSTDGPFD